MWVFMRSGEPVWCRLSEFKHEEGGETEPMVKGHPCLGVARHKVLENKQSHK